MQNETNLPATPAQTGTWTETKQVENSSQIAEIAYNKDTQTLKVVFLKGGAEYHYSDVPQETWEALRDAESVGKAFFALVKDKFSFQKNA